ncbi:SDR family oxidoreductase [Azohydromonas caseinilytica]|uniref:SDR family oxidoreductase n=1 Tax=Azohydromonas caseinilytica TaxID=2728836 RepID=A0A848F7I4_9BURK|nr:SDR family oxidoreductase [Azohydromonas caseinilytica]NML15322.1 SDR family oxidoreductase [Azohydromonas caseinilytica]
MQKVLVIGASRGIGLEFVRQYREAGAQVWATARGEQLTAVQALGATAWELDVADAASASSLSWRLDGLGLDVAIYCAGLIGPRSAGLEPPTQADFDAVMHVNVLGAMRLLPVMAEGLAPGGTLAVLSSVMASIGGRNSPSSWLYRASKAALNSVLKDAALVLQGRATCVALHPGWVRTAMGGEGAPLSVEESVAAQRRVLAGLRPEQSGSFFDEQGRVIPW